MSDPGVNPLQPYFNLAEQVIGGLGVQPDLCRQKDDKGNWIPGEWSLTKGSATIYVSIWIPDNNNPRGYCCIASPVMQVVTQKLKELYERLLTENHNMWAVSFSINQGWVWLRSLRECDGMDANELRAMFDRVGWYADDLDDKLKSEFGS